MGWNDEVEEKKRLEDNVCNVEDCCEKTVLCVGETQVDVHPCCLGIADVGAVDEGQAIDDEAVAKYEANEGE